MHSPRGEGAPQLNSKYQGEGQSLLGIQEYSVPELFHLDSESGNELGAQTKLGLFSNTRKKMAEVPLLLLTFSGGFMVFLWGTWLKSCPHETRMWTLVSVSHSQLHFLYTAQAARPLYFVEELV